MTSHPLPDLDEFAADARRVAVVGGRATVHGAVGRRPGLGRRLRELDGGAGARRDRPDPRLRAGEVRRRLGRAHLARGVRRPQPPDVVRADLPAGGGRLRRASPHRDVLGHPAARRSCRRAVGDRRAAGALRASDAAHRPDRLPAVLRDRGRLRPRGRAHPGRRARRPLGPRRPQGVDLRGAGRRPRCRGHPHRPGRGQARRAHRLPGADGRPGRHRAADPPDDRRQLLQRGLPRRGRAHRRPAAGSGRRRAGRSR